MAYTTLLDGTITPEEMTFFFRLTLLIVLIIILRGKQYGVSIATGFAFTLSSYLFAVGRFDLFILASNVATVLLFYILLTREK